MRALIASIVLLTSVAAHAGERVISPLFVGMGGMICDTAAEVKEAIAGKNPEGCGVLKRPMRMRVVFVEDLNDKFLVRYDFIGSPLPPQYGVFPKPKQAGLAT